MLKSQTPSLQPSFNINLQSKMGQNPSTEAQRRAPGYRYVYTPPPRPPTPPVQLTDTPWRKEIGWGLPLFSPASEQKMRQDMESQFDKESSGTRANILMLGPIKAGKSSFMNSVASITKGRIAAMALVGEAEASLTTEYGKFAPKRGIMKNFRILDCMGLERDGHGFNVEDAEYLVKGNVPRNYKFNPLHPISRDDPRFIKNPTMKDRVHCVVYVVDAEALYGDIPSELKKRITDLQKKLEDLGIQRMMILTKVDKLCDMVAEDISYIYHSVKVRDIVAKASEVFRLPESFIFPVKNYHSETCLDYKLNIPILLALKKMLNYAEDYIEKQEDSDED